MDSSNWAIQAFVDAHPSWKPFQTELITRQRDGWNYISLQGLEIGRVKVEGKAIIAEALIGYQKLG